MAFRIQIRRDTSSNWAINNPVLLQAEMGYETDTNKAKFGNGVDPWNDLEYFPNASATGSGSPIDTFFSGSLVGTGITGLNFTGSGVSSVSDSAGVTTITITGGTGGGGTSGTSGTSGSSGISVAGPTGASGSSGTSGSSGSSGISVAGPTGASGSSGTSGSSGISVAGPTGASGSSGTSGSSGISVAGPTGASGSSGTSGSSGISVAGPTGASGSSGTSGTSGSSGTSGISGATGATGSSGISAPYKLVVNISSGAVNSITALYSPAGASINGVGGWSVAANSPTSNAITITHPLGVPLTDFFSLGVNGANVLTRPVTDRLGYATTNYTCFQNSSYTTVTIYTITAANTGFASSGTGDFYILFFRAGQ